MGIKYISAIKKKKGGGGEREQSTDLCNHMDYSQKYYSKGKEPDTSSSDDFFYVKFKNR